MSMLLFRSGKVAGLAFASAISLVAVPAVAQERPDITAKHILEAELDYEWFRNKCGNAEEPGAVCEVTWLDDSAVLRALRIAYPGESKPREERDVGVFRLYMPELFFCEGPDERIVCTTVFGFDSAQGLANDLPRGESMLASWSEWVLERRAGMPFVPGDPFSYFEQEYGVIFSVKDEVVDHIGFCATPGSTRIVAQGAKC